MSLNEVVARHARISLATSGAVSAARLCTSAPLTKPWHNPFILDSLFQCPSLKSLAACTPRFGKATVRCVDRGWGIIKALPLPLLYTSYEHLQCCWANLPDANPAACEAACMVCVYADQLAFSNAPSLLLLALVQIKQGRAWAQAIKRERVQQPQGGPKGSRRGLQALLMLPACSRQVLTWCY